MRDLYTEAMLVRYDKAIPLLKTERGIDVLALIVAPSPELMELSLGVARERGVSSRARKLSAYVSRSEARRDKPKPVPKVIRTRPRKVRKRVLTIDEILARA